MRVHTGRLLVIGAVDALVDAGLIDLHSHDEMPEDKSLYFSYPDGTRCFAYARSVGFGEIIVTCVYGIEEVKDLTILGASAQPAAVRRWLSASTVATLFVERQTARYIMGDKKECYAYSAKRGVKSMIDDHGPAILQKERTYSIQGRNIL